MAPFTLAKKAQGILFISVIIGVSVLFTVYSENTAKYAAEALRTCAFAVVPSLFPFMVLSNIAAKIAPHLTYSGSGRTAIVLSVVLGSLCGFPVGAATVAAMYKNGALRKADAEHLCGLCNNTGPAFVIGVIGQCFWENRLLGMMFYICQIIAAFTVFYFCRIFIFERKYRARKDSISAFSPNAENASSITNNAILSDIPRVFCSSVSESAASVISVCGYVVFFKVICDTLRYFMPESSVSDMVYTVITCILEFTSGTQNAAIHGGALAVALCGFSISFSGISVIAQSTGILSRVGLSARPMFTMKLFAGVVCALLSYVSFRMIDFGDTITVGAYMPVRDTMLNISVGMVICSIVLSIFDRVFAKR